MKAWWGGLERRERRVLVAGALLMLAVFGWLMVWEPLEQARERRLAQVQAARDTLLFLEQALPEILARRADGAPGRGAAEQQRQSLIGLADASVREAGLSGVLGRVEPAGEGRVRLWFESAPFDALIDWADRISREHGVRLPEFSAERSVGSGRVDARLLLEERPGR